TPRGDRRMSGTGRGRFSMSYRSFRASSHRLQRVNRHSARCHSERDIGNRRALAAITYFEVACHRGGRWGRIVRPRPRGSLRHGAEAGTAATRDPPLRLNATCNLGITAKAAPVASICDAAGRASEDASRWPQYPPMRGDSPTMWVTRLISSVLLAAWYGCPSGNCYDGLPGLFHEN